MQLSSQARKFPLSTLQTISNRNQAQNCKEPNPRPHTVKLILGNRFWFQALVFDGFLNQGFKGCAFPFESSESLQPFKILNTVGDI